MIKFLQGIALILFAALCVVGIHKYSTLTADDDKEPEDPITEEVEEITEIGFKVNGPSVVDTNIVYQYENGMTWEEFLSINDDITGLSLDEDGCLYSTTYSIRFVDLNDNVITGSDELILTEGYYGPNGNQYFGYYVTISPAPSE